MHSFSFIEETIIETLNLAPSIRTASRFSWSAISGGDTHSNFRLQVWADPGQRRPLSFFVKTNQSVFFEVLKSEYDSLCTIEKLAANQCGLNYPRAILYNQHADYCFLVMEYLDLQILNAKPAAELGVHLARQHQISDTSFGWPTDNFIGLSEQSNIRHKSWEKYYRLERLGPQLKKAIQNGLHSDIVNRISSLVQNLGKYFDNYQPKASLLHGDLWSGNVAKVSRTGAPVLFDPAPYYGDRETDIAMTELFGRFLPEFYAEYEGVWPLDKGYSERKFLYNLYHALNHFNLFGVGYVNLLIQQLDRLDA